MNRQRQFAWRSAVAGLLALLLAGCGHKEKPQARVPAPPEITPKRSESAAVARPGKALYVETGLASWYGAPYHNRRGANGEIYDMHALTAAHRTLPMNSMALITNLQTGHSTTVRITDRGPFIEGRILDLSLEAAKQVDVWRPGTAKVRVEVLSAPAEIDRGGRWCVQIGAFKDRQAASRLKLSLTRRYQSATVLQFTGPTGDWIRVRVKDDEKQRAEALLKEVVPAEGAAFLVRLD